jgi:glycosyltransferase involved in cell wall biosynthesis
MLITGPVATRSGYGSHARDLVRSLVAMDKFDIHINSLRWGTCPMNALNEKDPNDKLIIDRIMKSNELSKQPDIHIQISVPNEFQPLAKYNIGVTAGIETTTPKPEWVDGLNKMNMNIVPSTFTKKVFEDVSYERVDEQTKQKVGELKSTRPMEVLFEGVDTNIFKKTNEFSKDFVDEINKIPEKFIFLYTGHWLQGKLGQDRKDTGMLVKTFLETFKNKVKQPALLMKTSGATFSVIDRNEILEKIENIKSTVTGKLPNICVLHGDLTDDEMNQMYNHPKVKAHVSFTHGEGFGRPLLEASLSEKPIIASDWSGHKDFLNNKLSVLLPGALVDVPKSGLSKDYRVDGSKWFTVNYQYASKIMLDIFKNQRKYNLNSKKLAIGNRVKYSLASMTKKFDGILKKYLPEFEEQPQAVNLKLPKLKKVGDSAPKKIQLPKLKKV